MVYGGSGDDHIVMANEGAGQHWNAEFYGGAGDDVLIGASEPFDAPRGNALLYGGAGDDRLIGGAGSDYLVGGPGLDQISAIEVGSLNVEPEGGYVLVPAHTNQDFDLTNLFVDHEVELAGIDLTGFGRSQIVIDATSVDRLADTRLDLTIDASDTLELRDEWTASGFLRVGPKVVQLGSNNEINAQLGISTATPFHNWFSALDINADGFVSPIDVLLIVNELNKGTNELVLSAGGTDDVHWFVDTNGDNSLSPVDALLVINHLNQLADGEGETIEEPATMVYAQRRVMNSKPAREETFDESLMYEDIARWRFETRQSQQDALEYTHDEALRELLWG